MFHPALKQLPIEKDPATTLEKLRCIRLFARMSDSELLDLAADIQECHYDKETIIFYESDLPSETGRRVYFVLQGCVKLVKYSTDGEDTIVRLASAGEFFGVTGALTNRALPFSAIAYTDTNMLTVDQEHFESMIRRYPQLAMDMLVSFGEMLWFHYETHNQVVKRTDARVSKIIYYHLQRDGYTQTAEGKQLNLLLSHHYIASMTGIAYEESVRIISRLKKEHNCIKYLRGGKIIVTDMNALKHLAQGDEFWGI